METTEERESYLKWYHNIFYPRICAQIRDCQEQLAIYEEFKSAVVKLKADLEECYAQINNTYGNAREGISCSDFDANIEEINEHGKTVQGYVIVVEGIIETIGNRITKINYEITSLRSQIHI